MPQEDFLRGAAGYGDDEQRRNAPAGREINLEFISSTLLIAANLAARMDKSQSWRDAVFSISQLNLINYLAKWQKTVRIGDLVPFCLTATALSIVLADAN